MRPGRVAELFASESEAAKAARLASLVRAPYYKRIHETIEDAEFGDDYRRGKFLLAKLPLGDSYQARKSVQEKDKGRSKR